MIRLNNKNILIVGGAGFIGSHLVDRLILENPRKIVVADNLFLGKKKNLKEAFEACPKLIFYKANSADYLKTKYIIKREQIDIIFNLAVIPLPTSLELPKWTIETNVNIVTNLCELQKLKYYDVMIHFSSSEVYGTAEKIPMSEEHPLSPNTPYAASKAACDLIVLSYIRTFGIDASIVRPFNTYGPRQNEKDYAGIIPIVIQKILKNKHVTVFGDGKQTRDYVYVSDVADAAVRIYKNIKTRGKVVNIASGKEISVNELMKKIFHIMDRKIYVKYGNKRLADVSRHIGDRRKADSILNFKPKINIDDGLRITIDWYKKYLKDKL